LALILGSIALTPPVYRYKDKLKISLYISSSVTKEMADEKYQVENSGESGTVLASLVIICLHLLCRGK
jgi:hypothetical protein